MSPTWQYRFIEQRGGRVVSEEVLTELRLAWKLCQPQSQAPHQWHTMMLPAVREGLETLPMDQALLVSWDEGPSGVACFLQRVMNQNTPLPTVWPLVPLAMDIPSQPPQTENDLQG